jgi:hypothetical protein
LRRAGRRREHAEVRRNARSDQSRVRRFLPAACRTLITVDARGQRTTPHLETLERRRRGSIATTQVAAQHRGTVRRRAPTLSVVKQKYRGRTRPEITWLRFTNELHVANVAAKYSIRTADPTPTLRNAQLSNVVEDFFPSVFADWDILVYKEKTKGGESMKIKVNVRAGKIRA